jgi:ribosomal protein S18 acetylase RimI-like enzyme
MIRNGSLELTVVPYRKARIRPYRQEDESLLFTLARGTFGERDAWSDTRTLAALETDTVFVAELGSDLAGYVAVEPAGEAVRIEQLFVAPLHENEGVGKQLLEYAEGYAIAEGAERLEMVVEGDNLRALELYKRLGFVSAGGDLYQLTLPQR